MLVLTRKVGEKIVIDGGIVVSIESIQGSRVKIGVQAPEDIRVLREELVGIAKEKEPVTAATPEPSLPPHGLEHLVAARRQ